MSTSFSLTTHDSIEKAIRLAGGQPTQFEELEAARVNANLLQQEWTTRGVNLWKVEPVQVTLSASAPSVTLDGSILDVMDLVIRTSVSTSALGTEVRDYIAERMSYKDYLPLLNKGQTGRPTRYLVERLKDATRVTLWPVPENGNYLLNMWAIKKFDDVNGISSNPDIPSRWLPSFTFGLGYYMALERSNGSQEWEAKLTRLKGEYDRLWGLAYDEDQDRTAFSIVPSLKK